MLGHPRLRSRRDRRWTRGRFTIAYLQVKNMPRPSIGMTSSQSSVCVLIAGVLPPRSHRFRPGAPAVCSNLQVAGWSALGEHVRRTATWRARRWQRVVWAGDVVAASAPTRSYTAAIGSILAWLLNRAAWPGTRRQPLGSGSDCNAGSLAPCLPWILVCGSMASVLGDRE